MNCSVPICLYSIECSVFDSVFANAKIIWHSMRCNSIRWVSAFKSRHCIIANWICAKHSIRSTILDLRHCHRCRVKFNDLWLHSHEWHEKQVNIEFATTWMDWRTSQGYYVQLTWIHLTMNINRHGTWLKNWIHFNHFRFFYFRLNVIFTHTKKGKKIKTNISKVTHRVIGEYTERGQILEIWKNGTATTMLDL